jgi:hypothetical protein
VKGRAIPYNAEEMAWLEANRLLPIAEYHAGFVAEFDREDVSVINLHSLRKRKGWKTGRTGQFAPGQESWNKGKPCPEGKGGRHPNAQRTQFKPGVRQGVAVKLYKPIGTERLSKEGYLERKIHDGMPLQSRWRAVHLVEWEAINGPVPPGHCLKCLDGDRLNTSPENWQLVSRGVLSRLNGGRHKTRLAFDAAEPEVKPAVMALAQVEQAAHERRKGRTA